MKTIAYQGDHHLGVWQLRHTLGIDLSIAAKNSCSKCRVQWWHFQFVAHGSAAATAPLIVVTINGLWRTIKRIYRFGKLRRRKIGGVQKGAFATQAVGVRGFGAQ